LGRSFNDSWACRQIIPHIGRGTETASLRRNRPMGVDIHAMEGLLAMPAASPIESKNFNCRTRIFKCI
jgi:hypothetical protein